MSWKNIHYGVLDIGGPPRKKTSSSRGTGPVVNALTPSPHPSLMGSVTSHRSSAGGRRVSHHVRSGREFIGADRGKARGSMMFAKVFKSDADA